MTVAECNGENEGVNQFESEGRPGKPILERGSG